MDRCPWRILEWAIKRAGLWGRYRVALGFDDPPLNIPLEHQVFLGMPFRRRARAAWCVVTGCTQVHGIRVVHRDEP